MIGQTLHGYRVSRGDVAKAAAKGLTVDRLLYLRRLYANIVEAQAEVALELFEDSYQKLSAARAAYRSAIGRAA